MDNMAFPLLNLVGQIQEIFFTVQIILIYVSAVYGGWKLK